MPSAADADVGEAPRERSRVRWDDDCMDRDLGSWEPLSPGEVSAALGGMPRPWWIAGGWAIDLHLGQETRAHADTDVLVLRDDQLEVQRRLVGWDLQAADPPGTLRPWSKGEVLPTSVRDVWCRRLPSSPWCLQLMFGDTADGEWVYHRDPRIRRPLAELDGPSSNAERRVLAPDIQLLYKSTDPREKDEADFRAMRGRLNTSEQNWLSDSLSVVSPLHPWLSVL